ncbi:MAG: hypothetical protein WEF99_09435 [Thermoanaerobaculia bacterium]
MRAPLSRKPLGGRRAEWWRLPLFVIAFSACAIPTKSSKADLVGQWRVDHAFGRELLNLKNDGSFDQTLTHKSGKSQHSSGRWDVKLDDGQSVVHLQSAIIFGDPFGKPSNELTPGDWDLRAVTVWGKLTLEFNPDLEGFTRGQ